MADNDKAATIEAANKEAKALVDMAESGAELEGKKLLLATRVEIIEKAIDVASKKLGSMPDDEYFAALYALVKKYAQSGEGTMLLSERDLGRLPKDFEKKINADLGAGDKIRRISLTALFSFTEILKSTAALRPSLKIQETPSKMNLTA